MIQPESEYVALEAFRMAIMNDNPEVAAENNNRRRASFTEAPSSDGNFGSLLRRIRMSAIISTTSSQSQTPITSPGTSRPNSRSTSPFRSVVVALPLLTVVRPSTDVTFTPLHPELRGIYVPVNP